MGKKTAVIFIMLANIIMLVHHFMPHHLPQPNEKICEIACHIKDIASKKCPHNHTQLFPPQSDNHHAAAWNLEDCQLEEIHIRFDNHNQIAQSDPLNFQLFTYSNPELTSDAAPVKELASHEIKPYLIKHYRSRFVRNTGLRAPPHC